MAEICVLLSGVAVVTTVVI